MAREKKQCEKKDAWHEYLDSTTFWERIDFDSVFTAASAFFFVAAGLVMLALCLYLFAHLLA